ncbi:MAG: hypothetical protein ACRESA_01410 [Gammaproteobacteria bacterium]
MVMKSFTVLALLLAAAVLAGCGGSSSSPSTPAAILFVVPGPWSGTYSLNSGSQVPVTGAVSAGGFGYFADGQGNVFMLQSVPNTTPFTSLLIGSPAPGTNFPKSTGVVTFLAKGEYASTSTSTAMQATLTAIDPTTGLATGLNGTFNLTTSSPYTGTPSVAGLQGQWDGFYLGNTSIAADLTFGSNGSFTGNDANGCTLSGSVVQQDPQSNLFYVNYTATGSGCPGVMNGLGFLSSAPLSGNFGGAAGTYLEFGIFGLSVAYTVELKLQ